MTDTKMTFEEKKKRALAVNEELKKLFPEARTALKYDNCFQLLVAVILSAQCTDKKVNEVTPVLFAKYPTLDTIAEAKQEEFEKVIYSTGFYRAKAKNIIATARKLRDEYGSVVPDTMEQLIMLPGVARKTANIVLGNCFGVVVGIAVDTHVKRLSNVLGLTNQQNPEKIEQDLMKIIPHEDWFDFTNRIIEYGRKYCPATKHDHAACPLTKILA